MIKYCVFADLHSGTQAKNQQSLSPTSIVLFTNAENIIITDNQRVRNLNLVKCHFAPFTATTLDITPWARKSRIL